MSEVNVIISPEIGVIFHSCAAETIVAAKVVQSITAENHFTARRCTGITGNSMKVCNGKMRVHFIFSVTSGTVHLHCPVVVYITVHRIASRKWEYILRETIVGPGIRSMRA